MFNNASTDETSFENQNRNLTQAIDALEHRPIDLGTARLRERLLTGWKVLLFGILLFTSSISSYFVIRDRWLEKPLSIEAVDEFWWNTAVLKSLAYPRYFLLIFIAMLLAALIVLLWRNQPSILFSPLRLGKVESRQDLAGKKRSGIGLALLAAAFVIASLSAAWMLFRGRIPGWDLILALALFAPGRFLLDCPEGALRAHLQTHGRFLLDVVLLILALCAALYATFGNDKPDLIFYVLLVLAAINFLRHRKITPAIFWVSIASLVALTWNLDSWHYVVIGDEYSFFTEVLNLLDQRSAWELINTTFHGTFVYGTHPYFSSYIHDFFMKLFDNRNFGWRFSNPFLVACSLPFFYYFFKTFVPRKIAMTTVVLLGFSHYLLSFSKIGYNNLQALFAMGLVLASVAWALQSMQPIAFSATGLAIGICFYLYPAALYVVPLPVLGLLIFMPPTNRASLKRWARMIVSAVLLVYPLAAQPKYWEAKIPGTFFYTEASNSMGMLVQNILRNTLYSALSFLHIPEQSHYVTTGYLDPLSGVFVVIGFVLLMKAIFQRDRSALFLALSFLMMFFMVGATHGRNFPTTTRMFLLLPWFILFAAFGLEWIAEVAHSLFHANRTVIVNLAVVSIVIVNLYQAYVMDVRNMVQYHSLAPMFVKTVREIEADPKIPPKSYAFVAPPGWNTNGMEIVQRAYLVPDSPRQLINLPVEGDWLPAGAFELVAQRDVVVIVKADMEAGLMARVDTQLQTWGRSMCEIRNGKGTLQFQLWHSGDLGWLCQ
jgi:hypothetical protein